MFRRVSYSSRAQSEELGAVFTPARKHSSQLRLTDSFLFSHNASGRVTQE